VQMMHRPTLIIYHIHHHLETAKRLLAS